MGTKVRIYRRDPRPLLPGACAQCGRAITLNPSGRRRAHKDREHQPCLGGGVMVGSPTGTDVDVLNVEIRVPSRTLSNDSTLAASPTGCCHVCERPISGERRLCGACFVKRGRS